MVLKEKLTSLSEVVVKSPIFSKEIKPKSLDISDAMAVGICYLNQFRIKW